jgi:hypothetical protein
LEKISKDGFFHFFVNFKATLLAFWIGIRAIFLDFKFVVDNYECSLLFGHKFWIIRYRAILNHDNFTETETDQEMMMQIFEGAHRGYGCHFPHRFC